MTSTPKSYFDECTPVIPTPGISLEVPTTNGNTHSPWQVCPGLATSPHSNWAAP
jgi:hypothetical protein